MFGTTLPSWLILTVSANPSVTQKNGLSTITADLIHDNRGKIQIGNYLPDKTTLEFKTTLGAITELSSTVNGIAKSILTCGTLNGVSTVYTTLDNQTVLISVTTDTVPPKISLTSPKNGATGFSRTANIAIKFSEYIKAGINWSKIVVKDKYGHTVHITTSISGSTIFIKTNTRAANSWYTVTIPKSAIRDYAGNELLTMYSFKFKTGT